MATKKPNPFAKVTDKKAMPADKKKADAKDGFKPFAKKK